jgi:hypothetical protein
MNINELKAARDAVAACIEMSDNTSVPENERVVWSQGTTAKPFIHIGMLKMILPFLDQAINAPDLEFLKREVINAVQSIRHNELSIDAGSAISEAIDHLAPRIVREGWQPIETAPKNKWLLLGYYNRLGNWRCVRGEWFDAQTIVEEWEYDGDPVQAEGFYETVENSEEIPNCFPIDPTHWMPLPQPPASKGD